MRRYATLILFVALLFAAPGQAVQSFSAVLEGAQEVPPVVTDASGSAVLELSDDEQSLAYTITTVGLDFAFQTESTDDDVILMHIHNAPAGDVGGVVFGMISPSHDTDDFNLAFDANTLTATISGVWDSTDGGEDLGSLLGELQGGNLYLNVHTNGNPMGEIRGQIVPQPATLGLTGMGLVALAWAGRPRSRRQRS